MATGYQGYAGYGDPERAKVDRQRRIAELLQEGALDSSPKSFWEGAAQLGKAFFARGANERADQAESAYADNRKKATDLLISQMYPDTQAVTKQELAAPGAVDLTPAGMEQRQAQGSMGDKVRSLAALLGDPMAAVAWAQGEDAKQYARGRDAMEDQRWNQQFGYQKERDAVGDQRWNTQFDYQQRRDSTQDEQWEQQFGFQKERAGVQDKQWGLTFGENKRQFDAKLAADQEAERLKREAAASGGAVFEGPQLATIYNKSMDALDDARKDQGRLDTIASTAQQFVDTAKQKGFWQQGEGFWNDMFQAFSMDTTTLKSLTDRIAPLMREAGSGASSDRDVEMFKSAVVSINNTPEANERFAKGAAALARRNNEYVRFLTQAITPNDPQSRQKADQLWNIYKNDQPLFDPESGAVQQVMPFDQWLAENMAETSAPAPPPAADDDVTDLLQKWGGR